MKPLANPFFVKFIIYFNDNQDFFECHEVLEDYWNSIPQRTKTHPLTGYILLATGLYHWRRGNTIGALRTIKKAQHKMSTMDSITPSFTEGIDFELLRENVDKSIQLIEAEVPFTSFKIEVTSHELQHAVKETVTSLKLLPAGSEAIIHKHLLRDRTEIIKMRDEKKKGRR